MSVRLALSLALAGMGGLLLRARRDGDGGLGRGAARGRRGGRPRGARRGGRRGGRRGVAGAVAAGGVGRAAGLASGPLMTLPSAKAPQATRATAGTASQAHRRAAGCSEGLPVGGDGRRARRVPLWRKRVRPRRAQRGRSCRHGPPEGLASRRRPGRSRCVAATGGGRRREPRGATPRGTPAASATVRASAGRSDAALARHASTTSRRSRGTVEGSSGRRVVDLRDGRRDGRAHVERLAAGDHLVRHDAERVDVARRGRRLAEGLLRADVVGRAEHLAGEGVPEPSPTRAIPKSVSLACPSGVTMMLAGLTSRCTTPASWAATAPGPPGRAASAPPRPAYRRRCRG